MNGETNPMANDGGERREGMTHAEDVYKLDIEEYLKTIRIPDSQRVYTGSDSGEFFSLLSSLTIRLKIVVSRSNLPSISL